jgi:hypothetical protein
MVKAIIPSMRPVERFFESFCGIAFDDAIRRAELEHWVVAMAQLLFDDDAFEIAQCRAHTLIALPETNKFVFDGLLAEPGGQKPGR